MLKPPLFLGADHAGFALKEQLKAALEKRGLAVQDLSPRYDKDDDYPLVGRRVALAVQGSPQSRGIVVCGSGVGVAIAANRVEGVRAVDGHSEKETKLAREHNDVNVLTLSGWNLKPRAALKIVEAFLKTPFSTAERHRRRVKQLG